LFSSDGIVTAEELQAIIDEVRLEDVLTKIDEVEQYEHIPADLKISRSEFVLALQDSTAKAQVLQKIDDIL